MKKTLAVLALLSGAVSGYSQGQVSWSDYNNPDFQITIWSPQVTDPGTEVQGNSPGTFGTGLSPTGPDIPAGTQTAYTGVPLGGVATGVVSPTDYANGNLWSVQLYAAPGANVPADSLVPVSGAIANIYSQFINRGLYDVTGNSDVSIPGVSAGEPATLQLRAWYNGNGAYTNYTAALNAGQPTGQSTTSTENLGGGLIFPPDLPGPGNPGVTGGITSFSLVGQPQVDVLTFLVEPTNQTVVAWSTATFSVVASGSQPLAYQWLFDNATISAATNSTFSVPNAQPADVGNYSVIVSDVYGSVTSQVATLTLSNVTILSQPASEGQVDWGDDFNTDFQITIWSPQAGAAQFIEVQGNSSTNFGTGLLATGPDIPSGTQDGYTGVPLGGTATGAVSPTNYANGSLWSVQLYAAPGTNVPAYLLAPAAGAVANMYTVAANQGLYDASGNPAAAMPGVPLDAGTTLQLRAWYNGNGAYPSYTAALNAGQLTGQSTTGSEMVGGDEFFPPDLPGPGNLDVIGGITSFSLVMPSGAIGPAPVFIVQATNLTILQGAAAAFSVVASGATPLAYQWLFNNVIISGATNSSLSVTDAQMADIGNYSVSVTNAYGSVTSLVATLSVIPLIAGLIDVAFTDSGVTAKTGLAAIGATTNDFWNTFDASFTLSLPGLAFVDGTASGASLGFAPPDSGATQNGASDPMYGTYVFAYNISIWITNLAPGAYDIYLYGHGKVDNQNSVFQLTAGSKSYGSEATTNGSGWQSSVWQEGVQYVVFTNVSVSAGQIITITVEPGTSLNFAALSGLQIAKSGLVPFVAIQSPNQEVVAGGYATFTAVAGGAPPLTYQWLLNNAAISGATNSSYVVTTAVSADAGDYSVIVSNQYGVATSQAATLTVSNILIFAPPTDEAVLQGTAATFSVVASGAAPLSYQWLFNDDAIYGATNSSYTVTNAQPANDGDYSVILTDTYGSLASPTAILTVTNISIITQPASQVAYQGAAATFTVDAIGPPPLEYQWLFNNAAISGTTNSSLSLASAQPADAGNYSVIVMNSHGSVTSQVASLMVPPLTILTQPESQVTILGGSATFSIVAIAGTPLAYQWLFNNVNLSGVTNAAYSVTYAVAAVGGQYSVVVTDAYGSVTSAVATLTVLAPAASVIDVAFTGAEQTTKTGFAATGVTTNDFWNTCEVAITTGYFYLSNLKFVDGAASGVGLDVDGTATWNGNGSPDPMYGDYAWAQAHNIVLTVRNLSPGPYDFYLYGHGNGDNQNGVYQLTSGTQNYGTQATTTNPGWLSTVWQEGVQYVVFRDVAVQAGGTVAITVEPGNSQYAVVSGIQITPWALPAVIVTQPLSQDVNPGSNATLSVVASGYAPLAYQWLFDNANISDATNTSYSVTNAQRTDGGQYSVIVTNAYGSVTSQVATLTVINIEILTQPVSQSVIQGASATFSVVATAGTPLAYQWLFNNVDIPGATDSTFSVTNAQSANAGNYSVIVTNIYGSITSAVATLNFIARVDLAIDVAFTGASVTSKTGFAATGVSTNDFWNTYDVVNTSDLPNLKYVGGTASGVGLAEANVYSLADNGASDPMYRVYAYASGNIILTVTNLFTGQYDFYLYGHGNVNDQNGVYQLTAGTQSYGTEATTNGAGWLSPVWQEGGQYVEFRDVAVQAWETVSITVEPGNSQYAVLSGLQITPSGPFPVIAIQPLNQKVNPEANATFSVVAGGADPLAYQWLFDSDEITGATNSSYSVTNAERVNAGQYSVVVINAYGSVTSLVATLTVINIAIITQPASQLAYQGASATFSVEADSTAPLAYQWLFNSYEITGATNSSYSVASVQPVDAGNYSVILTNLYGSVTSQVAILTVTNIAIITQPASQLAYQGGSATFSVAVDTIAPLAYQWLFNNADIPDATNSSYSLGNVQPADAGNYFVILTNIYGSLTSQVAALTVTNISIVTQPTNQFLFLGEIATVSVVAIAGTPLTYQWLFNGAEISGATNSSYTVSNAQPADSGSYSVVLTNIYGSLTSQAATLTVLNSSTAGAVINVAFTDGKVTSKVGLAAAGGTSNDFWNTCAASLYPGPDYGTGAATNLQFVDGSASGAGLTIAGADSFYGNGVPDPMYGVYLVNANRDITVTITNLIAGVFDFYLYGHGSVNGQNGVFQLTVGSLSYGTEGTTTGSGWNSTVWQEGVQYVEFNNVIVAAGQTITITAAPGSAGYSMIAGLQIASPGSGSPQNIAAPKRFVNVNQKVIPTKSIIPKGNPALSVIGGGRVEVSIGSSVAQAGQGTCVSVTLLTSAGLTNLSFTLTSPAGFLKNWTVNSTNSAIGSATVGKADSSEPQFVFGVQNGQVLQGSSVIGSICLDTMAGASAFVPLVVTNISAMAADNSAATNLLAQNGRVVVIGAQPLLDATLDTNLNPVLTLYGQPGVSYELLSTTNLIGGGPWSTAGNFTLTGLFQGINLAGASNQMQFFRAVQP